MTEQEKLDALAQRLRDGYARTVREIVEEFTTPEGRAKCANGTCDCAYHVDFLA